MMSKIYEDRHYAVLSNLIPFYPSWVQLFSSASYSQIPLVYVLPLISETKFNIQGNNLHIRIQYILEIGIS
jgi:hypothetical protein